MMGDATKVLEDTSNFGQCKNVAFIALTTSGIGAGYFMSVTSSLTTALLLEVLRRPCWYLIGSSLPKMALITRGEFACHILAI
jgi:nucleoside phosphorylase